MRHPFRVVNDFEEAMAEYVGSKYAIATDSCTNAIFMSLSFLGVHRRKISLPKKTYVSVPMSVIHAGGIPVFENIMWEKDGLYQLGDTGVWDSAKKMVPRMYQGGLQCVSFHLKKPLHIGKGGMIFTDDEKAASWLRRYRYEGRPEKELYGKSDITMLGWNMYMMPDQALRGLQLLSIFAKEGVVQYENYPDLTKFTVFKDYV